MNKITVILLLIYIYWCETRVYQDNICKSYDTPAICVNNNFRSVRLKSNYEYYDGELVHIECRPLSENMTLILINKGKTIYAIKPIGDDSVSMLVKLTAQYDGAVFECRFGVNIMTISLTLGTAVIAEEVRLNGLPLRSPHSSYYLNSYEEPFNLTYNNEKHTNFSVVDFNNESLIFYNQETNHAEITPKTEPLSNIHSYSISIDLDNGSTRTYYLDTISGLLCFDPYFTRLNLSKIVAKYKLSAYHNIIKYELDFEEDVMLFGCETVSSDDFNITVNGKISQNNLFKLYTKNGTRTHHRLINCSKEIDGVLMSTTVLDITRKNKNTVQATPIFIYDKEYSTGVKLASVDEQNTVLCANYDDEAPSFGVVMLTSVFVTMISTVFIMTLLYKVYIKVYHKRLNEHTSSLHTEEATAADADAILSADPHVMEPHYEPVNYTACKSKNNEAAVNISERAQCPLPHEESSENKKYIHYDTPYEYRIFRLGVRPHGLGAERLRHNAQTSQRH